VSATHERLRANDLRFLAVPRGLSDPDWSHPNLCSEWSNHEVLAHLVVGYRASPGSLARAIIRHHGSFDRANAWLARTLAAQRTPHELIDDFASLLGAPQGPGRIFPRRLLLGDHVIHELDIAYALGRHPTISAETLVAVLDTQVHVPNPFVPAAARARGLTMRATDVNWTHYDGGPVVAGTAADLASVLAGRPRALSRLDGNGVAMLHSRL
jgi:uncharacterized protein (TIGR03083 family)